MHEGHEKEQRNLLAKTYVIVQEIYNDIMTPIRQKLIYNDEKMKEEDRQMANKLSKAIAYGTAFEDIHLPLTNLELLRNDEDPFYSWYLTHVLCIDSFKHTEADYISALAGIPLTESKNTQAVLSKKINILQNQLKQSKKSHEFEL